MPTDGATAVAARAAGVARVQEGKASRASRQAASRSRGEMRQGTRSRKIMVNLLSKKRPDPATPRAGAGEPARENSEQIWNRTSA